MKYKGYLAQIEYSQEDDELFGTVVNISRDRICFGGKTVAELKKHMKETIDGHIKNCKALNIEPERPNQKKQPGPHHWRDITQPKDRFFGQPSITPNPRSGS